MKWNWQLSNWPHFTYNFKQIAQLEIDYFKQANICAGATLHFTEDKRQKLIIDILGKEAFSTSAIEGEILNRSSIQSSIKLNLGLNADNKKISPAERGIAELMINLYRSYSKPLSHQELFKWHELIMSGRQDLKSIGHYRMHEDPMQIISGAIHKPKIHFEAPPSYKVKIEMDRFIKWFNNFVPVQTAMPSALIRASIAHLYFESIHPFEDGNGRIGRAIVIKSLSQSLCAPVLISLSETIQKNKKAYYTMLATGSKTLNITEWIIYFSKTILKAQKHSMRLIKFFIDKTHLFTKFAKLINDRQTKVLLRIFKEGPDGFQGGLSAENYISISNASRATATRDLQALVKMGVLRKEGLLKNTRYYLTFK